MSASVLFSIILLIISCCTNVVFLEHMIKSVPKSGNMINFFQFLFVASEGLIFQSKFFTVKREIPLKKYFLMVALFFSSNITNMMALGFNIPMPLHMIFKSGSLVFNMIMGYLVIGRKYSYSKIASILLVSLGICICTLASNQVNEQVVFQGKMLVGLLLMLISLVTSARLGVYQETVFKEHGKHTREAAFYNHIIPLPMYLIFSGNIAESIEKFNLSSLETIPLIGVKLPVLWQYLILNLVTQYICIRCVFHLIASISSLSVTLLVTLRKFVSLAISVVYFGNHFSSQHCLGALFVLVGTLVYTRQEPTNAKEIVEKKTR